MFSPDRRFLAAIFPARIIIWDAETGRELKCLEQPKPWLTSAVFSPNGRTLAVLGSRLTLLEWQTDQERALNFGLLDGTEHDRDGNLQTRLRFSPDGRYLIVSRWGFNTPLAVFAVDGTGAKALYEFEECVGETVAVSPDSKCLVVGPIKREEGVSGFPCREVRFLDLATGKEQGRFQLEGLAQAAAFAPDGKTVALSEWGDKKGIIRLVDPVTSKERTRYELEEKDIPARLALSPNGKRIACFYDEFEYAILDTSTGRLRRYLSSRDFRKEFDTDLRMWIGTGDHQFWVYEVATNRTRHELPGDFAPSNHSEYVPRFVAAPDGRSVVVVCCYGSTDWSGYWDTVDGRPIHGPDKNGHWYDTISFSADGRTRIAKDDEGYLRYFDVRTGAERRKIRLAFDEHNPENLPPGFLPEKDVWVSPDLRWLVTSLYIPESPPDTRQTTRLLIHDLSGSGPPRKVSFSGSVHAWAWPNIVAWVRNEYESSLVLISSRTGHIQARFPAEVSQGRRHAFSADCRLVAVLDATKDQVEVYESATGRVIATIRTGQVEDMALTADNRRLLTAGKTGFRVWDLVSTQERMACSNRKLPADAIALTCRYVMVTPDGQKAITDAADGTGFVWDLGAFSVERLTVATTGADWTAWWADLLQPDAGAAYAGVWRFSEAPQDAVVQFLGARLKPVKGPDPVALKRWIADLGDEDFKTREAAQKQLADLGTLAKADLLRAVNGHESQEVRHRARELLDHMPLPIPKGESLRTVRAIGLLERIGTAEARKVLAMLASGVSSSPETEEAKVALERLGQRAAKP
jgi:WD40 repeat protein